MVNNRLLKKELERYDVRDSSKLKPVKYNKDLFNRLFEKYDDFGMVENSYCCYGLETCCWQEIVEWGVWDLELKDVKELILRDIKHAKKYLYNGRKYGHNRLHMYEDNEKCHIYIYLRDITGCDYSIWFENTSEALKYL